MSPFNNEKPLCSEDIFRVVRTENKTSRQEEGGDLVYMVPII